MTTEIKHRPYLSLTQIEHILSFPLQDKNLITQLKMIQMKAKAGLNEGSYKTSPRKKIDLESLGFTEERRYENNEMTEEEEKEFEQKLGL